MSRSIKGIYILYITSTAFLNVSLRLSVANWNTVAMTSMNKVCDALRQVSITVQYTTYLLNFVNCLDPLLCDDVLADSRLYIICLFFWMKNLSKVAY